MFKNKKMMNLLITLNCDSKCKHCYIKSVDDNSSKELSVDIWKKVFLKFKENGGEEISIHGGEPLMYKGLNELLIYANDIGLSTSIITNTLHLNREMITTFKLTNTYVLVSLDGPSENYRIFRGEDKLDQVTQNIDLMLKENISVHPICVIHNKNINYLQWLIDFVINRNIKTVTLSPIQPVGRASEQKDFHITSKNINHLINLIEELNEKYDGKVRFVTQALYRPSDMDKYITNKEQLLSYNDTILNVTNDGKVLMDLDVPNRNDYVVGTILDEKNTNVNVISFYKNLLNKAFLSGLENLRDGHAINFFEICQREAYKL